MLVLYVYMYILLYILISSFYKIIIYYDFTVYNLYNVPWVKLHDWMGIRGGSAHFQKYRSNIVSLNFL